MFCKKCGKELSDGAAFCTGCGTQITDAGDSVKNEKTVPVISLNTQGEIVKKKKGKWLIPTLVSAAILAIAAVVVFVWLLPGLGGGLDPVRKPAAESHVEYNQTAFKDNFEKISGMIRKFYAPKDGSTKNQIHLKVNEGVLELMGAQEQFGWLSDVKLSYDVTDKNSHSDVKMKLNIDGNYIASFEYLADKKKGDYWLILPDFNNTPVFVDVNPSPDATAVIYDTLAYVDELEEPVLKASEKLLTAFSSVEEVKETVTIDEVSQEVYILKAQMTRKELTETIIDIIEMLKDDPDFQAVLKKVMESYAGETGDVQELLDSAIDEMKDFMESDDFDGKDTICLNTYLDASNRIIGHDLIVAKKTLFSNLSVTDGENTGVKFIFNDNIKISGSGQETDGTFTGNMTMYLDGQVYADLELTDFKATDDAVTGTVRIAPTNRMMNAIYEMIELDPAWVNMLNKIGFTAEIRFEEDQKTAITISAGVGMEVATIEISGEEQEIEDVILPSKFADKSNASQMLQWTKDISVSEKLENIHDRLENVGMPEDIWDMAEVMLKNVLSLIALPT